MLCIWIHYHCNVHGWNVPVSTLLCFALVEISIQQNNCGQYVLPQGMLEPKLQMKISKIDENCTKWIKIFYLKERRRKLDLFGFVSFHHQTASWRMQEFVSQIRVVRFSRKAAIWEFPWTCQSFHACLIFWGALKYVFWLFHLL